MSKTITYDEILERALDHYGSVEALAHAVRKTTWTIRQWVIHEKTMPADAALLVAMLLEEELDMDRGEVERILRAGGVK